MIKNGKELFQACREHWVIKADNHVRDVNFGEDNIHCFLKNIPRVLATILGTVLNLLRRRNRNNNLAALKENLARKRRLANKMFLWIIFFIEGKIIYSDVAIEFCLTIRHLYSPAYRQTEGFIEDIFTLLYVSLPIPSYTQIQRRSTFLDVEFHCE